MDGKTYEINGLEFSIDREETSSFQDGSQGFIVYLKIDNRTVHRKKLTLSNSTYITNQREQLEQENWLTGYMCQEASIEKNSYKLAGIIFYKPKLKSIKNDDKLFITAKLPTDGKQVNICFEKNTYGWRIVETELSDVEIELTPKQLCKHLVKRIERLETFEERLNVSIQNISIEPDSINDWINLFCEIHPINGMDLKEDLTIECVFYDDEGMVIDKYTQSIYSEDFYGFELIEFSFNGKGVIERIAKIRIYPKKQ